MMRAAFKSSLCALTLALSALPALSQDARSSGSPKDPWEGFNRAVYNVNDAVDAALLKPVAVGYQKVVPDPARDGVKNFFGNLGDVWSTVNLLLQGKVVESARMTLRVASNTIFGLGGVLDPATEFGLERHSEDFGQTLGFWGVPPGPYVVLPLLGPSTLRDTAALPVDFKGGALGYVNDTGAVVTLSGLRVVSTRAGLLSAERLLADVALDKYSFLRDAYLARRQSLVYDGNPPEEPAEGQPAATVQ